MTGTLVGWWEATPVFIWFSVLPLLLAYYLLTRSRRALLAGVHDSDDCDDDCDD